MMERKQLGVIRQQVKEAGISDMQYKLIVKCMHFPEAHTSTATV